MRRLWPLLLPLIALAFAAPAVAAGPAWLDSQQISDVPHDGVDAAVAMTPDGTVIVAYEKRPHLTGPAPVRGSAQQLVVRQRPPDGSFGPEQVVDGIGLPLHPKLGIDVTGRAVLAWINGSTVNTAVAPPGGGFGDELSYGGETSPQDLNLGVDPGGAANLVWRDSATDLRIGTRPVSGPLSPVRSLDTAQPPSGGTDHIEEVALAEGPGGDAVAVWKHEVFDGMNSTEILDAARKPADGSYESPLQLRSVSGSGDDVNAPAIGVDPYGNALVAWTRGFGTTKVEARYWPGAGSPGSVEFPSSVPGVGTDANDPAVAFDSLGAAVVGFTSRVGGNNASQYTQRSPTGVYGPAGTLGTGSTIGDLHLASAGSQGEIVAGWVQGDAGEVAVKPVDGDFSPSHQVSAAADVNDGVKPAVDRANNAVVAFTQTDAGIPHIYAAGYDAAPPVLDLPSFPTRAVARVPLNVSFSPLDVWSGVAVASWTFGDGTPAVPASSTSHTYAKPGTYPVQAYAADALGMNSYVVGNVNVVSFLGSFGITTRTFAVGKRRTAVSAVKHGTTFRLTLGTPATLRIKIALKTRGVRVGKRCHAATRRLTRGKRRRSCTLYRSKGTLVRHGLVGAARLPFSGRIGRKALKPGRYRATGIATDSAGHTSTKSNVTFRVVLAKRARG